MKCCLIYFSLMYLRCIIISLFGFRLKKWDFVWQNSENCSQFFDLKLIFLFTGIPDIFIYYFILVPRPFILRLWETLYFEGSWFADAKNNRALTWLVHIFQRENKNVNKFSHRRKCVNKESAIRSQAHAPNSARTNAV